MRTWVSRLRVALAMRALHGRRGGGGGWGLTGQSGGC
jgi:hypothetical protein